MVNAVSGWENLKWKSKPFLKFFDDGFEGLLIGQFNLDANQPLYCFTDGIHTFKGFIQTLGVWKEDGYSNYVFQNIYDITIPLLTHCNLLAGGPVSYLSLFFFENTSNFLLNHYKWYLLIPFYSFYFVNWIIDYFVISDTLRWRFRAHKDIKNFMFMAGRTSNFFL